jgi:starch synthase
MKILFVASEAVPFAKTGGLADVAGAVPRCLAALGHDVALALPYYRSTRERFGSEAGKAVDRLEVDLDGSPTRGSLLRTTAPDSDVPVYLVDQPEFFDREGLYGTSEGDHEDNARRFIFFSKAVLQAAKKLDWRPNIYHCNDWQTALLPAELKFGLSSDSFYRDSRTVLTIHNLAYQGVFDAGAFDLTGLDRAEHFHMGEFEFWDQLNLLKGGLVHADVLTTVSRRYALEIQSTEYGCGLDGVLRQRADRLVGILNGIDYGVWNPATDTHIAANYSPDNLAGKAVCKRALQALSGLPAADVPLLGLVSRLADQKGLDLIAEIIERLLSLDVQFVLLGTGDPKYHELFEGIEGSHPDKFRAHLTFDNALAHQIEAGSDMFLMPSRYEPCGLNQLYSLKYGAVPIVRKTGGLADTIANCTPTTLGKGSANGFSFASVSPRGLLAAIRRALALYANRPVWRRLMLTGMRQDWSWERSARAYVDVYRAALE